MNSILLVVKEMFKLRLERKRQRHARQQERLEVLLASMEKNWEDIEQMEYALQMIERFEKEHRKPRVIRYDDVKDFFIYASSVYDSLQCRLHVHLNYHYFCSMLYVRYMFEGRTRAGQRRYLSFISVFSYFKRERGR